MRENFIIIPDSLLKVDISASAILLLGLLNSRSKSTGYAYTTNKYLSSKLKCSIRTITYLIKKLKDNNLIYIEDGNSFKRKIYVRYNFPNSKKIIS